MNQRADSWKKNLAPIVAKPPNKRRGCFLGHTLSPTDPRRLLRISAGETVQAAVSNLAQPSAGEAGDDVLALQTSPAGGSRPGNRH